MSSVAFPCRAWRLIISVLGGVGLACLQPSSANAATPLEQCFVWSKFGNSTAEGRDAGTTRQEQIKKLNDAANQPATGFSQANATYAKVIVGLVYNELRSKAPREVERIINITCLASIKSDQLSR